MCFYQGSYSSKLRPGSPGGGSGLSGGGSHVTSAAAAAAVAAAASSLSGGLAARWKKVSFSFTLGNERQLSFVALQQVQFWRRSKPAVFKEKQPGLWMFIQKNFWIISIRQTNLGELHQLRRPLPLQVPVFSGGIGCGRRGGRGSRVGGLLLARNRREFTGCWLNIPQKLGEINVFVHLVYFRFWLESTAGSRCWGLLTTTTGQP